MLTQISWEYSNQEIESQFFAEDLTDLRRQPSIQQIKCEFTEIGIRVWVISSGGTYLVPREDSQRIFNLTPVAEEDLGHPSSPSVVVLYDVNGGDLYDKSLEWFERQVRGGERPEEGRQVESSLFGDLLRDGFVHFTNVRSKALSLWERLRNTE